MRLLVGLLFITTHIMTSTFIQLEPQDWCFLHASSPQLNFRSFSSTASSKRTAFSGAMVQCSCPTPGAADHPSFHPTPALWSRSARVPRTASRWSPRSPWSAWSAGAGADVERRHGRCGCHRRTRRRRSQRQGLGRWAVGVFCIRYIVDHDHRSLFGTCHLIKVQRKERTSIFIWLVVWNMFFSIYWE